jgi:hypothetical protein
MERMRTSKMRRATNPNIEANKTNVDMALPLQFALTLALRALPLPEGEREGEGSIIL